MEKLILEAIGNHKKLAFYYDGCTRIVDPYFYGYFKSRKVLFAHQTGGFKLLRLKGLSIFYIDRINYLQLINVNFIPHTPYTNKERILKYTLP